MSRPPADSAAAHSPFELDATVLAHGRLTWQHEFRGVRFERLTGVALSDEPTVEARLEFALLDGHIVVSGSLSTELALTCQRCMTPMSLPVQEGFDLMLTREATIGEVPEQYEPWVTNAMHANAFELIEEQLLLALPLIAKHDDDSVCWRQLGKVVSNVMDAPGASVATDAVADESVVQRPFGQLRDLMRKP